MLKEAYGEKVKKPARSVDPITYAIPIIMTDFSQYTIMRSYGTGASYNKFITIILGTNQNKILKEENNSTRSHRGH